MTFSHGLVSPGMDGRRRVLPAGVRIYAVGDVHGRLDLLNTLLQKIDDDIVKRPAVRVVHVFLGDYIDRGAASRATIDRLIERGSQHESVFLKGNHEWLALKSLTDQTAFGQWMNLGGIETLQSYGIGADGVSAGRQIAKLQSAFHKALPQPHIRFFRELATSFTCGDFHFVHAGVRPGVGLTQQSENDLLWIRDEFLQSNDDFGKIIVHGHSPTAEVDVRPNRINIDTGAFATGRLTSLVIEKDVWGVIDTLTSSVR